MRIIAAAFVWTALGAAGAVGQEREVTETIASDRPGIGNGAYVMAPGESQIEVGLGFENAGGAIDRYQLGQALVRFGVSALEIRAGLNSFVLERNGVDREGFQDFSLGAKLPLHESDGVRLSAIATSTFPTGAEAFTAYEVVLDGGLLLDAALGGPAGVSVNGGYGRGLDSGADLFTLIVTPAVAVADGLGVYGGYAGFYADGGELHFLEGGLTLAVGADTQLDLNGGVVVDGDGHFLGVGLARRLAR